MMQRHFNRKYICRTPVTIIYETKISGSNITQKELLVLTSFINLQSKFKESKFTVSTFDIVELF